MAVDIGALIAESINAYYITSTPEWQSWAKAQFEECVARAKKQLLDETFNPKGSKSPEYRQGYKTGWARAARGQDTTNPPEGKSRAYVTGFTDGAQGHAKGQEVMSKAESDPAGAQKLAMQHFVNPYVTHRMSDPSYFNQPEDAQDAFADWFANNSGRHAMHLIDKYNREAQEAPEGQEPEGEHAGGMHDELAKMSQGRHKFIDIDKKRQQAKDFQAAEKLGMGYQDQKSGTGSAAVQDRAPLMEYKEQLEQDMFGPQAVDSHNRYLRSNGQEGRLNPLIQEFRDRNHEEPGEGVDPSRHDSHAAAQKHAHDLWQRSILKQLDELAANPESSDWPLQPVGLPAVAPHPDHPELYHAPNKKDTSFQFDPVQYVKDRMAHGWYVRGAQNAAIQKQIPHFHPARKVTDKGGQTKRLRHPHEGTLNGVTTRLKAWMNDMIPEFHPNHEMWGHHDGLHELAKGKELDYLNPADKRLPVSGVRARELKTLGTRDLEKAHQDAVAAGDEARAEKIKQQIDQVAQRVDPDKLAQRGERGSHRKHRRVPTPEETIDMVLNVVTEWLRENVEVTEEALPLVQEALYSRVVATYDNLFEVEN